MHDLRSELDAYASAGEPPMQLTFDTVMTAARRKHNRRRSTAIASGVAAVAAVAIAVPTLLAAPNSPPGNAAASGDCAAQTEQVSQVICIVQREVSRELPSPLRLDPPNVTSGARLMAPPPGASRIVKSDLLVHLDWRVSDGKTAIGFIDMSINRGEQDRPCGPDLHCKEHKGPRGETVQLLDSPESSETSLRFYSRGWAIYLRAGRPDAEANLNRQLLSVDAMTKLITTPELLP